MRRGAHGAALGAAVLLAAGAARADGVGALVEEDFNRGHTETVDANGVTQRLDSWALTQRYRLNLDKSFFPLLRFATGGLFEQLNGRSETDGVGNDLKNRTASFYANLTGGSPVLSASGGYSRRQAGAGGQANEQIHEELTALIAWKPLDLPTLSLRFSHPTTHDEERRSQDVVADQANLTATWQPLPQLDLRYSFDWSNPRDLLRGSDVTSVVQSGAANYSASLPTWRTSVGASLAVTGRRTLITAAGAGGTLATQQFPLAGLSVVEAFPATPALVALAPNAQLIDGNLTAGAGVNLGLLATPSGSAEVHSVDLGVQFADAVTPVNTLYVWTDQSLIDPAKNLDLSTRFAFTAWQSDDNLHWTQVGIVGQPVYPLFQNRFEITIQPTSARYLKLVTRPLTLADTTDTRFNNVLVTEVQAYNVTALTRSSGWQKSDSELFTLGLRTQLFGRNDLSFDTALQLSRAGQSGGASRETWSVASGLNYSRRLSPIFLVSARLGRQDSSQGEGHLGALVYSATLAADELPTLGQSLSYSGQVTTAAAGTSTGNSISFTNRAQILRGLALLVGASWSITTSAAGQTVRANVITVSTTVQPHPKLTLSGGYGRTGSLVTGGVNPSGLGHEQHFDATASFTPFAALYLTGSVSRTVTDVQGYTLGSVAAGFSPFQGGALQLTFGFNQSLDTSGNITRVIAPGLRWNISRSIVLSASTSLVDSTTGQLETHQRGFDVNLRIPL